KTWNNQRSISFESCERIAHDLFDCNNEELWTDVRPRSLSLSDLLELRYHRTGAKRAYAYASFAELGSECFGKPCHIRLRGSVNSRARNREKASRRTDVENGAPTLCDHSRNEMTSNQR